jgi:hypothetical protein
MVAVQPIPLLLERHDPQIPGEPHLKTPVFAMCDAEVGTNYRKGATSSRASKSRRQSGSHIRTENNAGVKRMQQQRNVQRQFCIQTTCGMLDNFETMEWISEVTDSPTAAGVTSNASSSNHPSSDRVGDKMASSCR